MNNDLPEMDYLFKSNNKKKWNVWSIALADILHIVREKSLLIQSPAVTRKTQHNKTQHNTTQRKTIWIKYCTSYKQRLTCFWNWNSRSARSIDKVYIELVVVAAWRGWRRRGESKLVVGRMKGKTPKVQSQQDKKKKLKNYPYR